jgi:protein kinase X
MEGIFHLFSFEINSAKDIIKALLKRDKMKRLGCLKDGVEDIKNHKWFKGVDWNVVRAKQIQAPIPVLIKGEKSEMY